MDAMNGISRFPDVPASARFGTVNVELHVRTPSADFDAAGEPTYHGNEVVHALPAVVTPTNAGDVRDLLPEGTRELDVRTFRIVLDERVPATDAYIVADGERWDVLRVWTNRRTHHRIAAIRRA